MSTAGIFEVLNPASFMSYRKVEQGHNNESLTKIESLKHQPGVEPNRWSRVTQIDLSRRLQDTFLTYFGDYGRNDKIPSLLCIKVNGRWGVVDYLLLGLPKLLSLISTFLFCLAILPGRMTEEKKMSSTMQLIGGLVSGVMFVAFSGVMIANMIVNWPVKALVSLGLTIASLPVILGANVIAKSIQHVQGEKLKKVIAKDIPQGNAKAKAMLNNISLEDVGVESVKPVQSQNNKQVEVELKYRKKWNATNPKYINIKNDETLKLTLSDTQFVRLLEVNRSARTANGYCNGHKSNPKDLEIHKKIFNKISRYPE